MFILSLYGNPNYPRNLVQDIIDEMEKFMKTTFLTSMQDDIFQILSKENMPDHVKRNIQRCFNEHGTIFGKVKTEQLRFKLLRNIGFVDHQLFEIGSAFIPQFVNNELRFVTEKLYAVHVPLRETLKIFLEIPGLFNQMLEHISNLQKGKNIITNIMQGNF